MNSRKRKATKHDKKPILETQEYKDMIDTAFGKKEITKTYKRPTPRNGKPLMMNEIHVHPRRLPHTLKKGFKPIH
jgi:hypothetical protein